MTKLYTRDPYRSSDFLPEDANRMFEQLLHEAPKWGRNLIIDGTNVYESARRTRMATFEGDVSYLHTDTELRLLRFPEGRCGLGMC